jgi:hypothetical protein
MALSETISTTRCVPPYQLPTVMGVQGVFGSSATAERLARREPFRRGLPICTPQAGCSPLVEGGVEPKASDEGDGVVEPPAAVQEL